MNFVKEFNTKADILIEKLSKSANGKTLVNLFNEINRATLDAIALVKSYLLKSYLKSFISFNKKKRLLLVSILIALMMKMLILTKL